MPVKKDETGKHWVEMEYLVPGTPEEVWQAIATGSGNAAWFTRATIEERVGGALRFDFAPGVSSSGEVTFWEPPRCFGYVEHGWAEGAPPCATEITITARSGGRCVVRMVHSLFSSTEDWDDQLEGFEGGWPGFFEVLRIYLGHFAGQPAASFQAMRFGIEAEALTVWTRLSQALGLAAANVGEHVTLPPEPQALAGTVEHVQQNAATRTVLMRLDAPGPGVALFGTHAMGDRLHVVATVFHYGPDASERAAAGEPLWRAWIEETFA